MDPMKFLNKDIKSNERIATPNTGLVLVQPEDTQIDIPMWNVYYKGVKFGEFDVLVDAYDRLEALIELDTTRK